MAKQYESYTKIRELGAGSFGKAFLVECQSDKSLAVIKQIDINSIKSKKEKDNIEKEGKILEQLNHINIIGFREVYNTKKGKIWIVMDYADGGDLSDKIKSTKESHEFITENEVLNYFTQMCLAIKHIHDRKIIHRDLKAQNIFLEKNGTIKLGDFGIAKVLEQTVAQANTQVGTPYYISPEIIKGKKYSFETDIWSLGVILYEMCALDVPIKAKNLHELYMKISSWKGVPPLPGMYSKELQDLVDNILVSDPKKRLSINQILKNDLLKSRVKRYLDASEFEEEFSHTILHNQYLFDKRKNRVKPPVTPSTPSIIQTPSMKKEYSYQEMKNESPFIKNSVAPTPKEANWVKQSPRAAAGFVGHKVLSSKKSSESKPNYRPQSVRNSANKNKRPLQKQKSNQPKGLVIRGEEIKPTVNRIDGRRKVSEMFQEESNRLAREKERIEQQILEREKERHNQIHERVNNIYKIDKSEEQKVSDIYKGGPSNFAQKPLEKQLNWLKPNDNNLESSKENNPFGEENKRNKVEAHAKEKIEKYRKSILNFLDSEDDNPECNDGLETNREVSDDGDRDDDNIFEGTQKTSKTPTILTEEEKDLDLDLDSDSEPVRITGGPYFKPWEEVQIDPLQLILKNLAIQKFGVENTETGVEFLKKRGDDLYLEDKRSILIDEFTTQWFSNLGDSYTEGNIRNSAESAADTTSSNISFLHMLLLQK